MIANIIKVIRLYWKINIFWGVVVLLSFLTTALSICGVYLPEESQVMYLSSTSAQVIAALYGLTVTGYIFFDGKLKSYTNEDSSLQDIIDNLRSSFRKEIITISIICFISMAFSISNILLRASSTKPICVNFRTKTPTSMSKTTLTPVPKPKQQ